MMFEEVTNFEYIWISYHTFLNGSLLLYLEHLLDRSLDYTSLHLSFNEIHVSCGIYSEFLFDIDFGEVKFGKCRGRRVFP